MPPDDLRAALRLVPADGSVHPDPQVCEYCGAPLAELLIPMLVGMVIGIVAGAIIGATLIARIRGVY